MLSTAFLLLPSPFFPFPFALRHNLLVRHVGRVLPKAVENAEVLRAARAGSVLRRWEEAVGEVLAQKSMPDRYDKGTVWVATQGSAWAQELRLMKPTILERLEAMGGERGMFIDIRFGVRPPRPTLVREEFAEELPPERPVVREERILKGPDPIPEEPKVESDRSLSIRERAERRLANWPKGE